MNVDRCKNNIFKKKTIKSFQVLIILDHSILKTKIKGMDHFRLIRS